MRQLVLSLIASFLLVGCMSPVNLNHVQRYTIAEEPEQTRVSVASNKSIMVMPINATTGYDTDAMLYSQAPFHINAFSENAWAAPPASMIGSLLTLALSDTHYFKAVLVEPVTANTDYVLNVRLVSLVQDFSVNPSVVRISVEANLSTGEGKPVANSQFAANVPTSANTPKDGVIATNQAVAKVLGEITEFTINVST